jgi:hypothetical protein
MEEDHLKDQSVDDKIILKWILGKWDWIHLAQDRKRWRTFLNAVMNLRFL